MIERQGKHTCESCGKQYEWIARMLEKGSIVVGDFEGVKSYNIQSFNVVNGRLIATGCCPYCGIFQSQNFVDEEFKM